MTTTEPDRPAAGRATHNFTDLISRLSLEQKVRLLTGADAWTLHGMPEILLRPLVMSDGPAGVRGTHFDREDLASSLPCPSALGATWDEDLVLRLARALGDEARSIGVDVLLAPTLNLVRTPLSGRGFECFSEDPFLTARLGVAYVRGLQAAGVAATAKHFVANDSETERRTYDALIPEDVLRELYLPPFEACVTEAEVALVMAAYNSVNGATMTANAALISSVLKAEWEFDGVVVSDWNAARTTVPTALAGLDLVMPGPRGPWGENLLAAVRDGRVPEAEIDGKVARLLALAEKLGALDGHAATQETAGRRAAIPPGLLREAAAESFVLLSNPRGLLPLDPATLGSVALVGPNAISPTTQGGGSVRVLPVIRPGLAEALRAALPAEAQVTVDQGCVAGPNVAAPPEGSLVDPVSATPGVRLEVFSAGGDSAFAAHHPSNIVGWWDGLPAAANEDGAQVVMRAQYRARKTGRYVLGAAGIGFLGLAVDGRLLAEARTVHPVDVVEAFSRPPEVRVPIDLDRGQEIEVRFSCRPDIRGTHAGFVTMRLGIARVVDDEALIEEAVAAAAAAEVAVVVVGSPEGSESEGFDRDSLALAGRQDELVRRVAAANPNTVVVVNAGTPVLMPWADEAAAVLQAWLPGQAFGEALADCLLGAAEPGGRLPVTLPRAEEDAPVRHARPDAGELEYSEGFLVGYRGYDRSATEPRFPFGHGLGYTGWQYEALHAAVATIRPGEDLGVVVSLRNAGERRGREVVQVYVEPLVGDPSRPIRTLAAFARVDAIAGAEVAVRLTLPSRCFARFDSASGGWTWQTGSYTLRAGRSSRDLRLEATVEVR